MKNKKSIKSRVDQIHAKTGQVWLEKQLEAEYIKPRNYIAEANNIVEAAATCINNLTEHTVLPKGGYTIAVLWCIATYTIDSFDAFPKLFAYSPEKKCGKSTFMGFVEAFSFNAKTTTNISPAAMFRLIELLKPTIILDEADTFLKSNDDMVGIINGGSYKSQAKIFRCATNTLEPTEYSTWTPVAIAGIGKGYLKEASLDRCIKIPLRRKLPTDKVQRVTFDVVRAFENIRQIFKEWTEENAEKLTLEQAIPPYQGDDRAVDMWVPMFTIAHHLGGDWPQACLESYELLAQDNSIEDETELLLNDIKSIFESKSCSRMTTEELVERLLEKIDHPWQSSNKGGAMTQHSLALKLKALGIRPKAMKFLGKTKQGYNLESFKEAFVRYC